MVVPVSPGRKVRTPQDRVPLKQRVPDEPETASATESKPPRSWARVKWWCKRPPVRPETTAAR